jgi:hypothetical protein
MSCRTAKKAEPWLSEAMSPMITALESCRGLKSASDFRHSNHREGRSRLQKYLYTPRIVASSAMPSFSSLLVPSINKSNSSRITDIFSSRSSVVRWIYTVLIPLVCSVSLNHSK